MTYSEALEYLYSATPVYQVTGAAAYKPGLGNAEALDSHYGHPHRSYKCIHVGGTNGKGSTSHSIAAVLQSAGYRVGLFTSPHLVSFRERIRVNGEPISESYVTSFTAEARAEVERIRPSFFELTSAMAMCYFRDMSVDVAVIEVGLGGRLDSTNIIHPILSVITNISLDHTALLGDSLEAIAGEKAGIIKADTPVVIGQASEPSVRRIFASTATALGAPIRFAHEEDAISSVQRDEAGDLIYHTKVWGQVTAQLQGQAQQENTATILTALDCLGVHFALTAEHVRTGLARVVELTGLRGRWETLRHTPLTLCDTAHNHAGIALVVEQLTALQASRRGTAHIVIGMASDKDVSAVLALLPHSPHFRYYFTQASTPRALSASTLTELAEAQGLSGGTYPTVAQALRAAEEGAQGEGDFMFAGGSNFIVADLLSLDIFN